MTGDKNYKVKDTIVVNTVEALLEELKQYDAEDIYVIGGASVYRQLLPYCKVAHAQKLTMHTKQIHIFRIWMKCRSGK